MSVHVFRADEEHLHAVDCPIGECPCDPEVTWLDDETGLPWANGPLVVHQEVS